MSRPLERGALRLGAASASAIAIAGLVADVLTHRAVRRMSELAFDDVERVFEQLRRLELIHGGVLVAATAVLVSALRTVRAHAPRRGRGPLALALVGFALACLAGTVAVLGALWLTPDAPAGGATSLLVWSWRTGSIAFAVGCVAVAVGCERAGRIGVGPTAAIAALALLHIGVPIAWRYGRLPAALTDHAQLLIGAIAAALAAGLAAILRAADRRQGGALPDAAGDWPTAGRGYRLVARALIARVVIAPLGAVLMMMVVASRSTGGARAVATLLPIATLLCTIATAVGLARARAVPAAAARAALSIALAGTIISGLVELYGLGLVGELIDGGRAVRREIADLDVVVRAIALVTYLAIAAAAGRALRALGSERADVTALQAGLVVVLAAAAAGQYLLAHGSPRSGGAAVGLVVALGMAVGALVVVLKLASRLHDVAALAETAPPPLPSAVARDAEPPPPL